MNLDEVIKNLEEELKDDEKIWSCEESKNEQKQILEWLKELRTLKLFLNQCNLTL